MQSNQRFYLIGLFVLTLILLGGCQKEQHYAPDGLRKLTLDEVKEGILTKKFKPGEIIYKDIKGSEIDDSAVKTIDPSLVFPDVYVNENGDAVEFVFREITAEEKQLFTEVNAQRGKLKEANSVENNIVEVNCNSIESLLNEALVADQENRSSSSVLDAEIDEKNQIIVASILEKCGFSALNEIGESAVYAAFIVIQHADIKLMEKYLPEFKDSARKGIIDFSLLAMMEDRVLMFNGKKQIYGTQVTKNKITDKWEFYPVENMEQLDSLRSNLGMMPIDEYLSRWNIKLEN